MVELDHSASVGEVYRHLAEKMKESSTPCPMSAAYRQNPTPNSHPRFPNWPIKPKVDVLGIGFNDPTYLTSFKFPRYVQLSSKNMI